MAMPDNPLNLGALYPQTRTQEKKAREQGLQDRQDLIDFFSFLARPAKGAALIAKAIEPEQHPDYRIPFDPKYSYPYGTPPAEIQREEAMKFAESVGFGTGNIGGMVGSTWLTQLAKKGYKGTEGTKLLADKWGSTTKAYYPEVKPQVQAWIDNLPDKTLEATNKTNAIINLLEKKGLKDPYVGKNAGTAKNAQDLWYELPHSIKLKYMAEAVKALDPAANVGALSLEQKVLKPGERFPLIEKAAEISKAAEKPAPAVYDPKMLQQPYAPGSTKGEVIKNFVEQAGFPGAPKQADFAAKATDLNELWAFMPPGVSSKAMKEALKELGIPHSTEPGDWLQHVLQPGERMPIISKALDLQNQMNALTGKPKPSTLAAPSIKKALDTDPYNIQRPMSGIALSVTSGAHKLSEEAARSVGYNIPAFKGMKWFDPEKPGLMVNTSSSEPAQFFTRRPLRVAAEYAGLERGQKSVPEWANNDYFAPVTLPVWLRALNPLVVGDSKKWMPYSGYKFEEALKRARDKGHDSVIFKNVSDIGGISNQYAVFDPSQIRSTSAAFKDWWSPNLMGARLVPPPPQKEE